MAITRNLATRPGPNETLPPNDKSTNTQWSNTLSRRRPDICSICGEGRHSPLACPRHNPVEGVPAGFDKPTDCGCYLESREVLPEEPGSKKRRILLTHHLCPPHRTPEPPICLEDLPTPNESVLMNVLRNSNYLLSNNAENLPIPDDLLYLPLATSTPGRSSSAPNPSSNSDHASDDNPDPAAPPRGQN